MYLIRNIIPKYIKTLIFLHFKFVIILPVNYRLHYSNTFQVHYRTKNVIIKIVLVHNYLMFLSEKRFLAHKYTYIHGYRPKMSYSNCNPSRNSIPFWKVVITIVRTYEYRFVSMVSYSVEEKNKLLFLFYHHLNTCMVV